MEDFQDTHAGGCMCGAVRYQVSGKPFWVGHCHCKSCRRHSGAPVVTFAGFSASQSISLRASDGSTTPHPASAEPSAARAERPSPGKAKASFLKGATSSNFTSAPWTSPRLSSRRTTYFTQRNCLGSTWPTICPGILAWISTVKYADTDRPTAVCRIGVTGAVRVPVPSHDQCRGWGRWDPTSICPNARIFNHLPD